MSEVNGVQRRKRIWMRMGRGMVPTTPCTPLSLSFGLLLPCPSSAQVVLVLIVGLGSDSSHTHAVALIFSWMSKRLAHYLAPKQGEQQKWAEYEYEYVEYGPDGELRSTIEWRGRVYPTGERTVLAVRSKTGQAGL